MKLWKSCQDWFQVSCRIQPFKKQRKWNSHGMQTQNRKLKLPKACLKAIQKNNLLLSVISLKSSQWPLKVLVRWSSYWETIHNSFVTYVVFYLLFSNARTSLSKLWCSVGSHVFSVFIIPNSFVGHINIIFVLRLDSTT